jgi:hypothetical protein
MNKKTAELIAKKAALQAYKITMTKLAQGYDPSKNRGGEVLYEPLNDKTVNKMEYTYNKNPAYFSDTETELLHGDRGATRKVPVDPEYAKWFKEQQKNDPFNFDGLEGDPLTNQLADDQLHADDKKKCPECGCVCKEKEEKEEKKKEAFKYSKLSKIAAIYQARLKK